MKKMSVKTVVAIGVGAALFFVLGRFVIIPSGIPNTNITLQYAVLGMFAVMYGPLAGALIGFIGHTLIDLSWGGSPWWSWVLASAAAGFIIGLVSQKLKVNKGIESGIFGKKEAACYTISMLIAQAVAFLLIAPVLDILIYVEPADKVFLQGGASVIVNTITGAGVGALLLLAYSKTVAKDGSLTKD